MKEHFERTSDLHQAREVEHNLLEKVVMTLCAVISGCEYWEDIVDFCRVKENCFREKQGLELTCGIALHDTFQRIFQLICPEELGKAFCRGSGVFTGSRKVRS